jgi:hypothetical protein
MGLGKRQWAIGGGDFFGREVMPHSTSTHHHSDFVPRSSFWDMSDGERLVAGPKAYICNDSTELWDISYGKQKPRPEKKLKPAPLVGRMDQFFKEKKKRSNFVFQRNAQPHARASANTSSNANRPFSSRTSKLATIIRPHQLRVLVASWQYTAYTDASRGHALSATNSG